MGLSGGPSLPSHILSLADFYSCRCQLSVYSCRYPSADSLARTALHAPSTLAPTRLVSGSLGQFPVIFCAEWVVSVKTGLQAVSRAVGLRRGKTNI